MNRLRRRVVFFFAAIAVTFCPTRHATAQTALYAGFSGAAINSGPENISYGALVGLYAQSGHYAYFGGDFRGSILSRNGFDYYSFAVGPRLAFKPPILPLRPYIEGLAGGTWYNAGRSTSTGSHVGYHVVAGVDWTLIPHVDWRVIDYDYSGNSGSTKANIFSTGLALRLW